MTKQKLVQINFVKTSFLIITRKKLILPAKTFVKVVSHNSKTNRIAFIANKSTSITLMMESNGLCVKFAKNGFIRNALNLLSNNV